MKPKLRTIGTNQTTLVLFAFGWYNIKIFQERYTLNWLVLSEYQKNWIFKYWSIYKRQYNTITHMYANRALFLKGSNTRSNTFITLYPSSFNEEESFLLFFRDFFSCIGQVLNNLNIYTVIFTMVLKQCKNFKQTFIDEGQWITP